MRERTLTTGRKGFMFIELLGVVAILGAMLFPALTTAGEKALAVTVADTGEPPMNCLLFFDDWMLQAREGLDRMQGQPVLLADVTPDVPEHLASARILWLFFDDRVGRYAMYVDCRTAGPESTRFEARVESDDPTDWPDLRGERAAEALRLSGETVVVDENGKPIAPFSITPLAGTPLADKGYVVTLETTFAFSRDGVHFQMVPNKSWKPWGSDTWNGAVYDPVRERYVIHSRPHGCDRRVARTLTSDFESFSPPEVMVHPDAQDPVRREFYGMPFAHYEDMFVGCLWNYDTELAEKSMLKMIGSVQTQLTYSYDADHWYRAFRDRMLIGRDGEGTPSGGSVYGWAPIRTPDDRVLIPTWAYWGDHGAHNPPNVCSSVIYELRLDGFAYLRTRARHGMIRTKALVSEGDELTLNVRTNRSGHVKVQVLDGATFKPIPHYTLDEAIPITGDHLFAKAQWKDRDNIAELKGRPVILEVHVREGELYALRLAYKAFYTGWCAHRI